MAAFFILSSFCRDVKKGTLNRSNIWNKAVSSNLATKWLLYGNYVFLAQQTNPFIQ